MNDPKVTELERQLSDLKREFYHFKSFHAHDGTEGQRVSITDLYDLIPVVDVEPSHVPKDFSQQFVIYKNSTTYRFYWHDGTGWRYATGT